MIVRVAIPLSMLFAFCGHVSFRHRGQLAEPGSDRLRMIVDSSVVRVEIACGTLPTAKIGTGR